MVTPLFSMTDGSGVAVDETAKSLFVANKKDPSAVYQVRGFQASSLSCVFVAFESADTHTLRVAWCILMSRSLHCRQA